MVRECQMCASSSHSASLTGCSNWWWVVGMETWHRTLTGGRALSDGFRVHDMLTDGQMAGWETHLVPCDSRVLPCVLGQSLNHERDLWACLDRDNVMWLYCESIKCIQCPCVHLYCYIVTSFIFRLFSAENVGSWHGRHVLTSLIVESNSSPGCPSVRVYCSLMRRKHTAITQ